MKVLRTCLVLLCGLCWTVSGRPSDSPFSKTVRLHPTTKFHELPIKRRPTTTPKELSENVPRGGNGFLDTHKQSLGGALFLGLMERGIHKLLVALNLKFPSQLAGCISLFFLLLLADVVKPGMGESMFVALSPGSTFLAKWFQALFIPGLVTLPMAPSIGNFAEVFKFLMVTGLGFLFSLSTTAYTVHFLRSGRGPPAAAPPSPVATSNSPSAKPYREETLRLLVQLAVVSGAISVMATRMGHEWSNPIRTIYFMVATFASFVWGARLPSNFNKVIHPLISSSAVMTGVIQLTALATGMKFMDALQTYKTGTLDVMKTGAGDALLFLMGPCVISFAVSMYSRRKLLMDNLFIVMCAMVVSAVGSLIGTAAFVNVIQLGGEAGAMVRRSVIARNVTTALSMACTAILGGNVSLAVLIVVLTGLLGVTVGRGILDAMGIHDPITRGIAIGGSTQGLGASSMVVEPDAFPFAAISMIMTAVLSTVLVSIPAVKDFLVTLANG